MRVTFMFHLIHLTHLSLTFLWMMISKYTTHTLRSQLPHRLLLVNKVLTVFNILSAFIRSFLKLAGASSDACREAATCKTVYLSSIYLCSLCKQPQRPVRLSVSSPAN